MGWRRTVAATAVAAVLLGTATASGAQQPTTTATCTPDGDTLVVQLGAPQPRFPELARFGDELVELGDYQAPFESCGSLVGIERLRILGTSGDDRVGLGIQRIDPNFGGGPTVALGLEVDVALGAGEDEVIFVGFQYESLRIRATGPHEISTDPARPGPEVDITEASAMITFHVAPAVGTTPAEPALDDVVDLRALAPVPDGVFHFTEGGNDRLRGHDGPDIFNTYMRSGSTVMFGYGGDDEFWVGPGDVVHPGPGDDRVLGADLGVRVVYRLATGPVAVDLERGVTTSATEGTDGFGDEVTTIIGSNFADTILGTTADEVLRGRAGDDVIDGRGGADELRGGRGTDTCVGPPPAVRIGCEA
jgi:Ca2+-binding RTX toxin-like protein